MKLASNDMLIIEIKFEDDVRKGWFINLSSNINQIVKCALCEQKIDEMKIPCEYCTQYVYCSDGCRKLDDIHINYHNNLNKLYKKQFDLSDLLSINISDVLPPNSRRGLTGLKNLGNTCFMNSALQCLSHTEELTKYFLLKKYVEEINKKNKYGSGGSIAKAYYELVKELWMGNSPYLSPWDFRQIFVGFVKQFAGFCQHDSHEMLAFMLDTLHEDLNRVKEKPYFELKEKQMSETEEGASKRWWESHLARENSIIVDMFHGQYKSVITCPKCKRISITYDAFMYLGLPIPHAPMKILFKFFPLLNNNKDPYLFKEFELTINENTTVRDMKNKILSEFKIDPNNIETLLTSQKFFKRRLIDTNSILPFYENGYEIVIYETELCVDSKDVATFYVLPMEFVEEKSFMSSSLNKSKVQQPLFYVKPFTFSKNMKVRNLYVFLFKYYRKIILNLEDRTYEEFNENRRNLEYINEEFTCYFKQRDCPFNLYILNNIPSSGSMHLTKCEFCDRSCDYCSFDISLDVTLESIMSKQKVKRSFLLFMELLSYNKKNLFDKLNPKDMKGIILKKSNVTLYDCLDSFKTEERLEKDNAWYCSICKEHQEAYKKLEIYSAPNILIVQFKRFKIKSTNSMMGMNINKKNDSLIEFPVNGLDFRNYIVGNDKESAVYDLFAISQHFGSMSGGHYTALCRNDNKWYEFDDERVSPSDGHVVTSAAYLLFYRKKSLNKKY